MADQYRNFFELQKNEKIQVDYDISVVERASGVLILAPHGGLIEPHTSQIARLIAGDEHSLYTFDGLRQRPHRDLHIASDHFDEPEALRLVGTALVVVTIHGLVGDAEFVDVGGRDSSLRDAVCGMLRSAAYHAHTVTGGPHAGTSAENICNRGQRAAGVQLEISRALRNRLGASSCAMRSFCDGVRAAVTVEFERMTQ